MDSKAPWAIAILAVMIFRGVSQAIDISLNEARIPTTLDVVGSFGAAGLALAILLEGNP